MYQKSKVFFNEFCCIFAPGSELRNKAVSCYDNNPAFTNCVVERINAIIEKLDYNYQNEYFRIDASGWRPRWTELQENIERPKKFNAHLWDLMIAVEHENDPKDWLDEIVKLAHICCPLRVVIGYLSVKQAEKYDTFKEYDMLYLDYAAKALTKLGCYYNLQHGEFMVVLGNSDTGRNPEKYFNYRAYVFDGAKERFVPLV